MNFKEFTTVILGFLMCELWCALLIVYLIKDLKINPNIALLSCVLFVSVIFAPFICIADESRRERTKMNEKGML